MMMIGMTMMMMMMIGMTMISQGEELRPTIELIQ